MVPGRGSFHHNQPYLPIDADRLVAISALTTCTQTTTHAQSDRIKITLGPEKLLCLSLSFFNSPSPSCLTLTGFTCNLLGGAVFTHTFLHTLLAPCPKRGPLLSHARVVGEHAARVFLHVHHLKGNFGRITQAVPTRP